MRWFPCFGLFLLLHSVADAQVVRGTIVDGTATPVAGVVIALLDSASNTVARALSNDRGEYRVTLPASGTFRIRTLRIGYRPTFSAPIAIGAEAELERRIVLEGLPIALDTLRVDARASCHTVGDSGMATYAVWEQVRAALTATQLTTSGLPLEATLVSYERRLDPSTRRIAAQQSRVQSGLVAQPWRALDVDSLHRAGYVFVSDTQVVYYAPGIETLLSDAFVEDHCFHLTRQADLLGIAFEPSSERTKLPEISGTLWLDQATTELRRVEFHYANISDEMASGAGGELTFVRLRGGEWAIGRWAITMPVLARRVGRNARDGPFRLVETELRVSGGDLVLARRGSDTLWARPPQRLRGVVVDSANGASLSGARVSLAGTYLGAVSDARGRFMIDGVLPGDYIAEVSPPSLDSEPPYQLPLSLTDVGVDVRLRVPLPHTALLVGTVFDVSTKTPIPTAQVQLVDLTRVAFANQRGEFRLDAIEPGAHHLLVRRIGYSPLDTTIVFAAGRRLDRKIFLAPVVTLDSVVTTASNAIPSFEENRRVGLGHFFTRAELEAQHVQSLAQALDFVPGVTVRRGRGSFAWVARTHGAVYGGKLPELDTGDKTYRGAPPNTCYAHVFLNNTEVYHGRDREPLFDVNSIPVNLIEAMEYYSGPAETPLKYSGLNTQCGVLVIWTRVTYP